MAASSPAGALSASAKRKREREEVHDEECFAVWRKTRSTSSLVQEDANVRRWFSTHNPELGIESPPEGRKSLEEIGDLGFLEEYYRREFAEEHKQLEESFYDCDAVTLARRLLGKFLYNRESIILRITEVEAYPEGDSAFNSLFGKEPPNSYVYDRGGIMFDRGRGSLYITADKEGVGAVVLIKACSVVAGLLTIQVRRDCSSPKPELLNTPQKVGEALCVTVFPQDLRDGKYGMLLLDGATPESILVGPRVWKRHADPQDLSKPWRFAIAGTPWISKPHNTLVPLT